MPTTDQTNKTGEDTPKLSDAALKGNSGSHSETTPITPITVGEPTDAASLAIDQKHMEDYASSDLKPGVVECRPYLRYGCRHTRPQPWHFTIPSTAHPRPDVRALFGAQRVAGTHPDQGCAPRPHHLHLGMVADSIRTAGRRTDVSEFSDARKRVRIIALGIRACRRPADHRLCP
jgi:hypothetical protein